MACSWLDHAASGLNKVTNNFLRFAFTTRPSIDLRSLPNLTCWSIIHKVRFRLKTNLPTITAALPFCL